MNKPAKLCVIVAVLLLAAVCLAGVSVADDTGYTECNGKICVDNCLFIKCDLSTLEGTAIASEVTILTDHSDISPGLLLIETPAGMTVSEAVTYFENLPGVEYVEPNYITDVPLDDAVPVDDPVLLISSSSSGDTFPNDPRFSEQWALRNMNVPAAWDVTTGSRDVVVAVIDTGVNYNHLDIIDNMWKNPGEIPNNGIDDDKNGYVDDYYGYNFGDNTSDPIDLDGHGTHVAGIIGAVGNNGIGISGVNQEVSIMALRIACDDGSISFEAMVQAIEYATKMGANVLNMSLGGYLNDPVRTAALKAAADKEILVVTAAGNESEDNDVVKAYPSCNEIPNILAVSALDSTDSLPVYSNYGSFTRDVAAPGGGLPYDLLSLSHDDNDGYVLKSGTSMASPMVAGLAALLLSENPNLTAVDLKCIIMATVTPDPELEGIVVTGGRVNAGEAVKNAVHNKYHMITFNSLVKKEGIETMMETGSQVVEDGTCITEPENPSKYFMKFAGWYTDKEFTIPWNFSTPVTEDVNLYAKWVEDTSLPVDTSWYTPEQTEYHISTASQLMGLSKIVYDAPYDESDPASYAFNGKTVVLDNDISLAGIDWIPIGVAGNNAFSGVFDGAGHTISNLSINLPKENLVGLFGYNTGRVTNLVLNASYITGYNFVGTLCGIGNRMDHVHVTVDTIKGHNAVGGLIGYRPTGEDTSGDADITITITNAMYVDTSTKAEVYGITAKGAGGAIGWGSGNNITVIAGDIISKIPDPERGGRYVGGAFGYADAGFHDVSVYVSSISAQKAVGGIAGYATGDISNSSAVVGSLNAVEGGGAVGWYSPMDVSRTANGDGNTIKDIFVSVNGNAAGGAIGYINSDTAEEGKSCKLTIENVLIAGNISDSALCGGIAGKINGCQEVPLTVSIRNSVSLLQSIGSSETEITGRIYATVDGDSEVSVADNYGWEGTVNSSGESFEPSDKNGENVATSDVWNNQSFFETLGWDFTDTWKMNAGNSNFKLPVLQNTLGTGILDASYLVHRTAGFSLPSLLEMKDGAYMIDFEKDAGAKVVETTPVTETKTATSPVPILGILAGLGIAGFVALRRH